jgi:hypothetical protein
LNRASPIDRIHVAVLDLGLGVCFCALAGCAISSTSFDVQDLGDGTYSVPIRSAAVEGQDKVLTEAIRKAGEYCHARGQKLQNVPNSSRTEFHFRCVGAVEPPAAAAAPAAEQPAQ